MTSDNEISALGRSVERTGRRITDLERLVRQIAGDLAEVAAATLAPEGGDPATVRSWLLADDPAQAAADLAELLDWTRRIYLRYPDAALSACWLWHPDVIEELWWLRHAHADAYHPTTGTWQRVADWHERHRPGVAKRVLAAIGTCELALHRAGAPVPPAPLAEHASGLATAWATDPLAPRPEPTDTQLDHADTYTRQQLRRT